MKKYIVCALVVAQLVLTSPAFAEEEQGVVGRSMAYVGEKADNAWDTVSSGAGSAWGYTKSVAGSAWDGVTGLFESKAVSAAEQAPVAAEMTVVPTRPVVVSSVGTRMGEGTRATVLNGVRVLYDVLATHRAGEASDMSLRLGFNQEAEIILDGEGHVREDLTEALIRYGEEAMWLHAVQMYLDDGNVRNAARVLEDYVLNAGGLERPLIHCTKEQSDRLGSAMLDVFAVYYRTVLVHNSKDADDAVARFQLLHRSTNLSDYARVLVELAK